MAKIKRVLKMEATAISETTKKTVKFINDHNNVQKMERM